MNDTAIQPMTSEQAAEFAPTWGSFMTSGDPGACMYGFSNSGRPQNETHRKQCIDYMTGNLAKVRAEPERWNDDGRTADDEIEDIEAFLAWMRTAPALDAEPEPASPVDRTVEFQNTNLCTITYGAVLDAIEATDSDPFTMSIVDPVEWAAIAQCVNQGIDSRLEAITNGHDEFSNGSCSITPANLCVLLRRLTEGPYSEDDQFDQDDVDDADLHDGATTADLIWNAAERLQSDILTCLGFDDCGKYVGRDD